MTRRTLGEPAAPPARGSGLWNLLVVVASMAICAALSALYWQQQRTQAEAATMLRELRQARVDLASGFLYLTQSDRPDSPWDAGQGRVLLQQALQAFRQSPSGLVATDPMSQALQAEVERLAPLLAPAADRHGAAQDAALRIGLHALDQAAAAADAALDERLAELRRQQQRHFQWAMGGSAAALLLICVGVVRTGRSQREATLALARREREFRAMVSALDDAVLIVDDRGRVLRCNPAAERYFGRSATEWATAAAPLTDRAAWGADGQPLAPALMPLRQVLEGGPACHGLLLGDQRPGQAGLTWLRVSAEPVHNLQGQLECVVLSFADVTEQRRNAEELARHRDHLEQRVAERTAALVEAVQARETSERFARNVADSVPGRIAYWTPDERCAFINRAYCEWLGLPPAELLGRTMQDILPALYAERRPRLLAALAGRVQRFEREEAGRGGETVYSDVQYLPDWQHGQVRGVQVLAVNITAHKRAEQALRDLNAELGRARDRAEAASRAKSAFLANMSHEIRTPLSAIIGLSYLLQRGATDPVQLDRLGKVHLAAHHLLNVISDILDLSKIEAGKLELEHTVFSLDALLSRTCAFVADTAHAKGLELVLDTDHLPDHLTGDPTRLSQALLNLLSNAVKFTERGSVVLRGEHLRTLDDGRYEVRFEVRDTGIGLAADQLETVFEAFTQADASTTRRHGGTGLGLAITQRIAALMEGRAGARSRLGEGSTFWFTAILSPARGGVEVRRRPHLAGLRCLVVDDLPEARDALADMLRVLGLQVEVADGGVQAVALAAAARAAGHPHDLAVIDWRMPDMDGLATLPALQAGGPPVQALLVSACEDAGLSQQATAAGFGAVLLKPVTPSMLNDSLMRLVGGTRPEALAPDLDDGQLEQLLRARHAGARVLVAEDNRVNQEVATELLRAVGLQVEVADDGAAALRRVSERRYDLVLMDVQMPELDGLQATRTLRSLPQCVTLPILAMTANVFGEDRQACLDAGMDDHVAKPVDPPALYSALLRWLPGRLGPGRPAPGSSEPRAAWGDSMATDAAPPVPPPAPAAPAPAASASAWPAMEAPAVPVLPVVEGLDLARALQLCGGSVALCRRTLLLFARHHGTVAGAWPAAREVPDPAELAAAAHALRSASATIGAQDLLQALQALEAACRPPAPAPVLKAHDEAVRQALARLLASLRAAGLAPPQESA